jgi:hypothetical protein
MYSLYVIRKVITPEIRPKRITNAKESFENCPRMKPGYSNITGLFLEIFINDCFFD